MIPIEKIYSADTSSYNQKSAKARIYGASRRFGRREWPACLFVRRFERIQEPVERRVHGDDDPRGLAVPHPAFRLP